MALPIFTITIFVSAFLLFLVQPLVGKLILPKLGGTPQVWNTCMVFFQSALLLGYAYTHSVSTRLKLRQQLMIHAAILAVPILVMLVFPIYATVQGWNFPSEGNPIPNTLMLLAIIIGIPFFVVSTSAPLLQKWFGYSGHATAKDPYFLYSASNAGSLLSLFFYPAFIEPFTTLPTQSYIWFAGYVALFALIVLCAYTTYKLAPSDEAILAAEAAAGQAPAPVPDAPPLAPAPAVESATAVKSGPAPAGPRGIQRKKGLKMPGKYEEARVIERNDVRLFSSGVNAEMTTWRRIRWILLAAVPSSLMLGVTSYISTDLSPFPLVWVIPLALYLLSFIIVYMKGWTGRRIQVFGPPGYTFHQMIVYVAHPLGLMALAFIVIRGGFDPFYATTCVMAGFFASALACHGELAQDRPDTKHLTEYFLLMSVGGAVGGIFNGIVAPIVFQSGVLEFYIAIVVACFVRPQYVTSGWFDELVLQAFPGLQNWSRNQGDEMAKSMGRPAPRTTYLFNILIDILFGLFILVLAYWLTTLFSPFARGSRDTLEKFMKFLQLPLTQKWLQYTYNFVALGIPAGFIFFFSGRPLRMGLAVLGLLLGNMYFANRDDRVLEARRTYFGLLRVMQDSEIARDPEENQLFRKNKVTKDEERYLPYPYTYLMHGTTYHGRNYVKDSPDQFQKVRVDLSRLATTYYHRYGPVGIVMEQYNWLRSYQNTFHADLRMPTAMVGQIAASLGTGALPLPALVETWSEPPFATIGLGTGTMASYARPYQHMTYYEIDEVIRGFSLPEDGGEGRFTYLQGAIKRGVNLEVIMGDARLSLEKDREPKNHNNSLVYSGDFKSKGFPIEKPVHSVTPNRNRFYHSMVVDAFSSDAIPIHLCTKQALQIYMDKLTDDGILLMHTSNRHMDLVRPVARIAMELSIESKKNGMKDAEAIEDAKTRQEAIDNLTINCIVGKDLGDRERYMGHFTSEYVILYRGEGFANYLKALEKKKTELVEGNKMSAKEGGAPDGYQILNSQVEWYDPYKDHTEVQNGRLVRRPITKEDSLWTDDYSYILGVLR